MTTFFEEDTQPVNDNTSSTGIPVIEKREAAAAFARIEPELATIPDRNLVRISVDVARAVAIGLGALPMLFGMRRQIVEGLPTFPIDQLDKLQCYALGALHCHQLATEPEATSRVQALVAEAMPLRERLMWGAQALVHFGILDEARMAKIRGGTGHLDTGADLIALGALFKEKWAEIGSKTPVQASEVARASELGIELVTAVGARMHPNGEPITVAESADRRVRAFTLYVNAYDTCRRALTFLRWAEKDVDQIMPTLFSRPKRRVYQPEEEEPAVETTSGQPAEATTVPAAAAPAATTGTVASGPTPTNAANGPSPPSPEVPKAA